MLLSFSVWLVRTICIAAIAVAAFAAPAWSCGNIQYWIDAYSEQRLSDEHRIDAIEHLSVICNGYRAEQSDRLLLRIVDDGLRRAYPKPLLQRFFDRYRCMSGARAEASYAAIAMQLDVSRCPTEGELAEWQVVNVGQAIVRQAASRSSGIVTQFERGTVVTRRDTVGDWLRVESWSGKGGFVHKSLLRPFSAGVIE